MELTPPNPQFIQASPRPELGGELGLTLHEIATSLGAEFWNVKRRAEQLMERGLISGPPIRGPNNTNNLEVESYVLPLEDAKFMIAKYDNDIANGYCRFLISRETQFTAAQHKLSRISPLLKEMIGLELAQLELKDKQSELSAELIVSNNRIAKVETNISQSTITNLQQIELMELIDEVAIKLYGNNKVGSGLVIRRLKNKFNLNSTRQTFKDLPQSEFDSALAFLRSICF